MSEEAERVLIEQEYIQLHRHLQTIAYAAAQAKIQVIGAYLERYHPGVSSTITVVDENVLSLTLVFPGLGKRASRQLAQELADYLQRLLESGKKLLDAQVKS